MDKSCIVNSKSETLDWTSNLRSRISNLQCRIRPILNSGAILLILIASSGYFRVSAQDVRSHTRPAPSTAVDEKQALDLTLTLSQASVRPVQTWVRTAGKIDKAGKTLTGYVYPPDANLIKTGQRVRAFPLESKSSMYQARVTRVVPQGSRVMVDVALASLGREGSSNYIMTPCLFAIVEDIRQRRSKKNAKAAETEIPSEVVKG